ncbi:endonuclease/exonuclease/phosphatase family protein [Pseudokineococcus sp. 1T1Z-3]|uniref:endonuclease/exonuclease/phosphatase family protein n=1 Tax=Pseudokineococcus sp. 1T1Z-3 TaxID=3132745 RepID=UPI0030A9BEDD
MTTEALVLAVTAVVLGSALTALRWWDVRPGRPGAPLVVRAQALVPGAGALGVVVLVPSLVAGEGVLAAAAGALVAVHAAVAAPAWLARPPRAQEDPAPRLRVAALNVWYGRADVEAAAALLQRLRPDLVALVEISPPALAHLEETGALAPYPYRVGRAAEGGVGTVLAARWPMEEVLTDDDELPRHGIVRAQVVEQQLWGLFERPLADARDPASDNPAARLHLPAGAGHGGPDGTASAGAADGASVLVRAAHPYYPALRDVRPWRRQLAALERWCRAQTGPVVVLGDLNATPDHPALRRLLVPAGPMRRAAAEAGRGRLPTWPVAGPLPGFRGLIALDHVLVDGLDVRGAGARRVRGTDHRAVWADLALSPPSRRSA